MSDWHLIFVVGGGLYLVECILSIRRSELGVYTPITSFKWKPGKAEEWFGNDRLGFSVGNPLVLAGCLVIPKGFPICLSPTGITNFAPDEIDGTGASGRYFPFDAITDVQSRFDELLVNGEVFTLVRSADWAHRIRRDISMLAGLPMEEREAQIRLWVSERLNERCVAEDWSRFRNASRSVRALATALLLLCYCVSPFAVFGFGPSPTWKYLLSAVLLLGASTAIAHYRAHQKLYPLDRYERWVQALSIVLYPPAGMRCADKLSVNVLAAYSPAVVLPFLCGRQAAMSDIRKYRVDIERAAQRPASTLSADADACATWFSKVVGDTTRLAWKRMDVDVFGPPTQEDEFAHSYCPRCHAQFREGTSRCSDCDEHPLVAFVSVAEAKDAVTLS